MRDGACESVEGVRGVFVPNVWVPDDVYVFSMCHHNLADALGSRVLAPNREAVARVDKEDPLWAEAKALARKLARHCYGLRPLTDAEFLSKYSGSKRKRYAAVLGRLLNDEAPNLIVWTIIKPFVKVEKYWLYVKMGRISRPIQPRSLEYRAYVGKYISAIERDMKSWVIPGQAFPFVAKGACSEKLASLFLKKWELFAEPVTFGLDMSKFDSTITAELKKLENLVFAAIPSTWLYRGLLALQEKSHRWRLPKGFAERKFNTKSVFRCSGDPQTGCGNTLLMGVLVTTVFAGVKIEIFANGDDTNVICEKRDLQVLLDRLPRFGVFGCDVKLESPPTSDLEEIFWCQCYLTFCTGRWLWIREWKRTITTILNNTEYDRKNYQKQMRAIAYAEAVQNPGQPIVSEVCRWILDNWRGFGKFRHHQDTLSRVALEESPTINTNVEPGMRNLFDRRYGISAGVQAIIARDIIDTLKSLGEDFTRYDWVGQNHPYGCGLAHDGK